MQMGCGRPNADRSQHCIPSKQLFGATVHPCTRHWCVMKVSQNVASVSAQSAVLVHALPAPIGGRLQKAGASVASQA
jgi:hypothetical protein